MKLLLVILFIANVVKDAVLKVMVNDIELFVFIDNLNTLESIVQRLAVFVIS